MMIKQRKDWREFRDSGLLLFVNQFLHIFGWAIVVETFGDGKSANAYPAKVSWRGFSHDSQGEAYTNLTNHMADNIDQLKKDIED